MSFNYCQRERVRLHLLATIWKGGENCQEDQNQGNSFLELFISGAKAQGVRKYVLSPENFIFLNEDFSTLRKVIYFT